MLRILTILALAALLCNTGCTPVRTVYDANGNEVQEDDAAGGESDLMSVYEKKFNESFAVKKTADGVPQTVSNKVSSFQRDLEKARGTTERFSTRDFDTGSGLDWKNKSFAGASKEFNTGKTAYDKRSNSMFSRDMQPDFMNESHGISHSDRYLSTADNRSSAEGRISETSSYYISETAPFSTNETDHYFESRRDKAGQPVIIDHREYYKKHRQGIRELLGRDNVPL